MNASDPDPSILTELHTHDPAQAREFVAQAYADNRLSVLRMSEQFEFRLIRRHRGSVFTDTHAHTMDLNCTIVEPLGFLSIAQVMDGRVQRRVGGFDDWYQAGDVYLVAEPHLPYQTRVIDTSLEIIGLDLSTVAEVTGDRRHAEPGGLRWTSLTPVSPAAALHWTRAQTYVARLLADPDPAAPLVTPLVTAQAARLLAATALSTFPNNTVVSPTIEDRHDAHHDTLRRAISYIDSHADQDISVADIAAACSVTVRAVQLAFRRHLDTTPTAYLRRVRLQHAHEQLRDADPEHGHTVTAVAARWGFANPSRFTAYYRQEFGQPPSRTLRS